MACYGYNRGYPRPGENIFNPQLPFKAPIEGGVYEGRTVSISGYVSGGCDSFYINVITDEGGETLAMHFNPRFGEGKVVLNSLIDGEWGEEERPDVFPFEQNNQFDMTITFREKGYKIKVNGQKIKFASRYDMYSASWIEVGGDIDVQTIRYGGGDDLNQGYQPPPPLVEAPSFAQPDASNRGMIKNPVIPYNGKIYGGIEPGKMILIQGYAHPDADKLTFNLQSIHEDIGLHFDVRFDSQQVVRNTYIQGDWGGEEDHGDFPFKRAAAFEVIINAEDDCYKIAVNGRHFTEFYYRMDRDDADRIQITGDVTIGCIRVSGGKSLYNNDVPNEYTEGIPGGLRDGKLIFMSGIPNPRPSRFSLNLQCGDFPESDIALHFNPRFDCEEVVRNTRVDGGWPEEERDQPYFPFRPNHPFDIVIRCAPGEFQIFVNGDHFCNFAHRLADFDCMDTLKVEGDVEITHVRVV